jgi:hypothetical protein
MANTDAKVKQGIGRRLFGNQQNAATPAPPPTPTTPGVQPIQSGNVRLITYSPEEVLQQVEERRASVSFDRSKTAAFMDNFSQHWSWIGPIIFALGTIGEIFVVLWGRQRVQDLLAGSSIIAVSMLAEGTLLAVSFSSKRLRNRADKRSTGWTPRETKKLATLKTFWVVLGLGVAATQFAFILAQTRPDFIGTMGVIAIAVVRSLVALIADCYTAFASEEAPTTGEQALEVADKELEFTNKLLAQKAVEVEVLNKGAVKVQEIVNAMEMAQENQRTQMELDRMENQGKIETKRALQENAAMLNRMQNSALRAVFDPQMPDDERHKVLTMLNALMGAQNQLPASTKVVEEKHTDQLNGL